LALPRQALSYLEEEALGSRQKDRLTVLLRQPRSCQRQSVRRFSLKGEREIAVDRQVKGASIDARPLLPAGHYRQLAVALVLSRNSK
jgi:hypothetical protein